MDFNLLDLVGDSKRAMKKVNKKKLHVLLNKYGSVEEIERSGNLKDGFELDFARTDGALNLLHKSLNDFGYPCKKLLTKQMIPMLNKINNDDKSDEFSEFLKSNYTKHLKKSPNAKKYKGWFPRIERL